MSHELSKHWYNPEGVDVGDTVWVRVDNGIMRWKRRVTVVDLELNKFGFPMPTIEYEDGQRRAIGISEVYKHDGLMLPHYEPRPPKEVMREAWKKGK